MSVFKHIGRIYTSTAEWTDELVDGARKLVTVEKGKPFRPNFDAMKDKVGFIGNLGNNSLIVGLHGLLRLEDTAVKEGATTADRIAIMYGAQRRAIRDAKKELQSQYRALERASRSQELKNNPAELEQVRQRMRDLKSEEAQLFGREMMSYAHEGLAYGKRLWQHTFQEGTTMDRVKKGIAYGGIYMTGNIALRGLTGGGVTYNNDGERDIAGIPLI